MIFRINFEVYTKLSQKQFWNRAWTRKHIGNIKGTSGGSTGRRRLGSWVGQSLKKLFPGGDRGKTLLPPFLQSCTLNNLLAVPKETCFALATPRPKLPDKIVPDGARRKSCWFYLASWTRSLQETWRKLARLCQTTPDSVFFVNKGKFWCCLA